MGMEQRKEKRMSPKKVGLFSDNNAFQVDETNGRYRRAFGGRSTAEIRARNAGRTVKGSSNLILHHQ